MLELAPNIYYLQGQNQSRFPYCACLYIKGRDLRVLIDACMGEINMAPALASGIEVLILSHCHIDHRLTRTMIPEVPVWCHAREEIYLQNRDYLFRAMVLYRSGLDLAELFDFPDKAFEVEISRILNDRDRLDLGGITLEILHTPGHTPGHCAFYIPEHDLLFTGDIDLTPFGPFYGHDFANVSDFLTSIDKLKQVGATRAVSSHAGPFNGNLAGRFEEYGAIVHNRDRLLLEKLDRPQSLKYFKGSNLFYPAYPDFPDLIRWFEMVHIEKHLERLQAMGKVQREKNQWTRV